MAELKLNRTLLEADGIRRALRRMAREITESASDLDKLAIVGIHTGGVHLAQRIAQYIEEDEGQPPARGMIDITLYRDDVFIGLPQPVVGRTELSFDMDGKELVLVDDVLYTGRTVRAALDALMDYGRPRCVRLAVLVDRGCRELPIQADYVGLAVTTGPSDSIKVALTETGADEDKVQRYERATPEGQGGAS